MDYQWKYRVVKRAFQAPHNIDDVTFAIYEVYRDDNDKIVAIAERESAAGGDSADALRTDIAQMMEAFSLPVMDYGQITEQIAKKEKP